MYVDDSRLTRPLWALPLSHMRITTAIVETLPYALRGIWPSAVENKLIKLFVQLRDFVLEVTPHTHVPTASTEALGDWQVIFHFFFCSIFFLLRLYYFLYFQCS